MSAATRPALENSDRMLAAGSSPNQIERREAANFGTVRARARVMASYSKGVLLEMGRKFVNRWEDLGWHSDLEKGSIEGGSNSCSGTSASCCHLLDWSSEIPRSESLVAVEAFFGRPLSFSIPFNNFVVASVGAPVVSLDR